MEQITIREIAKLCGVGVTTVSRAINNHPDISKETKQKIMDTIAEYHYIPNNSARNLKRTESKTIAVLAKGISNPFFADFIRVAEREIIRKKYSFILQHVDEDEDEVEVAIQLEKEKRLKGIIFLGGMHRHEEERLRLLTVPSVISTVNMQLPDTVEDCCVVSIEDEAESRRMVEYLCRLGHRRIALLTAPQGDVGIGSTRLMGYQRALEENGIAFDPSLVVYTKHEEDQQTFTIHSGYEAMRAFLEERVPFTAVFAISDTLAIGACKALSDAGKQVPEDVSVTGFDGLDIAGYYIPSVTTIEQPREEMAEKTVQLLFDMIRSKPVQRKTIFQARLREGQSTRRI